MSATSVERRSKNVDVLSNVLQAVRLTGAIFFDMHFNPPFVGESPPMSAIAGSVMPEAERVINFHVLLDGACFAEIVGGDLPPVKLAEGDVVMFPLGDANVITSQPSNCSLAVDAFGEEADLTRESGCDSRMG